MSTEQDRLNQIADQMRDWALQHGYAVGSAELKRDPLAELDQLAKRFAGIDVKYRRDIGQWTARLITSKNERDNYRITCIGATPLEAIIALLDAVHAEDKR